MHFFIERTFFFVQREKTLFELTLKYIYEYSKYKGIGVEIKLKKLKLPKLCTNLCLLKRDITLTELK